MDSTEISTDPREWQELIGAAEDLVGSLSPLESAYEAASPRLDALPHAYELQSMFDSRAAAIFNEPPPIRQEEVPSQANTSSRAATEPSEYNMSIRRGGKSAQPVEYRQKIAQESAAIALFFAARKTAIARRMMTLRPDIQMVYLDDDIPNSLADVLQQHPEKCAQTFALLVYLKEFLLMEESVMRMFALQLWNEPLESLIPCFSILVIRYRIAVAYP